MKSFVGIKKGLQWRTNLVIAILYVFMLLCFFSNHHYLTLMICRPLGSSGLISNSFVAHSLASSFLSFWI